jgi:hypothetical protein
LDIQQQEVTTNGMIGTYTQLFDSFYHNDDGIDIFVDLTDTNLDDIRCNEIPETTNIHQMTTPFKLGAIKGKTTLNSIFSLFSQNVNISKPKNFEEACVDYN